MYGQIFARSDLNDSGSGKTTRVWSDAGNLDFSVDAVHNQFVLKATCCEPIGTGDRGGTPIDVTREFLLQLEKDEVEKLVETAVLQKLLKKMAIRNLAKIDKVSSLELAIEQLREELAVAKKLIGQLNRKISKANAVLSAEA